MSGPAWLVALVDEWRERADPVYSGLARGLASLRAGHTALAARQFDFEWNRRDPETALLAAQLGFYAEVRTYNLLPNGAGTSAIDVRSQWNANARVTHFQTLTREARAWSNPTRALAMRWVRSAASVPAAAASLRGARHDHRMTDALLPVMRGSLEDALQDAPEIDPAARGAIARAIAALAHHAGNRDLALRELERAREASAGDELGLIACDALAADWRMVACAPALVGDLELDEAPGPTSDLAWSVEQVEATGTCDREVLAQLAALHERALALGATRLAGAIKLRQAHAAALAGDRDDRIAHTGAAVAHFQAAGDAMHGYLAQTHLALAQPAALAANLAVAREIGKWGRSDGSYSYALGLGLMMTRAARLALVREGDYEHADAGLQLALAINDELGATLRLGQTHADLASLHFSLGNRDRARTYIETALDTLLRAPCDLPEVPQRIALLTQELFGDAVEHKEPGGIASALARVEKLHVQSSPGDVASIAVQGLLATIRSQAEVLIPLYTGVEHHKRGDEERARAAYDEALARTATRANDGSPYAAIIHATAEQFADALREYDAFLATGGIAAGLASQLLSAVTSQDFIARESAALQLRQAQTDLTFYVRVKAYDRALTALERIETLTASKTWWADDPRPWRPLSDIGETFEGRGELDRAAAYYGLAIDELERRRRLMSRDELRTALAADYGAQYLYFQAVRTELARGRLAAAFELSERGRARALLDLVASNLHQPTRSGEPMLVRRWRELAMRSQMWSGLIARLRSSSQGDAMERARSLTDKLQACEAELRDVTDRLATEVPQFADLVRTEVDVASLAEITRSLPPRTAILIYMTLGRELLAWSVTGGGDSVVHVASIPAVVLARRTRDFHSACARGDVLDGGAALASELLAPFDAVIADHEHLVVVPYGELHRLPFAALPWRGRYLGEVRDLSHVPSATLYGRLARSDAGAPRTILAIGNPDAMAEPRLDDGDAIPLPPLAAAREEARHAEQLYGGELLVGPAATLRAVTAALPRHRLVHFGSHGLLSTESPLRSGIALAGGECLTVQDLLALRFDVDLVTLSACRTGLGVVTGGEEVVGLTRGLLAAGARCAVVSLWSVNDVATAVLMRAFYEELHGGAHPSTAMRRAQAAVRSAAPGTLQREAPAESPLVPTDGNHPRYWAPFVVVGVWPKERP